MNGKTVYELAKYSKEFDRDKLARYCRESRSSERMTVETMTAPQAFDLAAGGMGGDVFREVLATFETKGAALAELKKYMAEISGGWGRFSAVHVETYAVDEIAVDEDGEEVEFFGAVDCCKLLRNYFERDDEGDE